jgi:hypothetical protein
MGMTKALYTAACDRADRVTDAAEDALLARVRRLGVCWGCGFSCCGGGRVGGRRGRCTGV